MAGDWIPVRKDLATTREVLYIAQHTGHDIGTVIYAILRLWWWFDSEAVDGFVSGLCPGFVHNFLGQDEQFWRTVVESGWLLERDGGLAIPNPENWHSKTAKVRLLDSRRKRDSRNKVPVPSVESPAVVPPTAGQEPDKTVTIGQDRIGDKKKSKSHSPKADKPSLSDHPAIQSVRKCLKRFPDKELWPEIIALVGETPDEVKLDRCMTAWLHISPNRGNMTWLFEWFRNGIPKGNGKAEALELDKNSPEYLASRGYGKNTFSSLP